MAINPSIVVYSNKKSDRVLTIADTNETGPREIAQTVRNKLQLAKINSLIITSGNAIVLPLIKRITSSIGSLRIAKAQNTGASPRLRDRVLPTTAMTLQLVFVQHMQRSIQNLTESEGQGTC